MQDGEILVRRNLGLWSAFAFKQWRRWRLGTVSMNYVFEIIKPKRIEGRNIYFLVVNAMIIHLMIGIVVFDRRLDVIP